MSACRNEEQIKAIPLPIHSTLTICFLEGTMTEPLLKPCSMHLFASCPQSMDLSRLKSVYICFNLLSTNTLKHISCVLMSMNEVCCGCKCWTVYMKGAILLSGPRSIMYTSQGWQCLGLPQEQMWRLDK